MKLHKKEEGSKMIQVIVVFKKYRLRVTKKREKEIQTMTKTLPIVMLETDARVWL
jgi:hypothetical protein